MENIMERVFFIPRVNNVKIKNYGIIQDATIKFKKGLNIITGINGSGKTTVIEFLLNKFIPNYLAQGDSIMMQIDSILDDNKTIIIDDVLGRLDRYQLNKTLSKLSKSGRQIILTLNRGGLSGVNIKMKVNIIDTKDFKLKLLKTAHLS